MVWVSIAVLIAILVVVGILIDQSKKVTLLPNQGTRAVVFPTRLGPITVIVPPCGTGASVTGSATSLMNTVGTTSVAVPADTGERVVLVPRCTGGVGAAGAVSGLPSAAFVPQPGSPLPGIGTSPNSPVHSSSSSSATIGVAASNDAQFILTVPAGSPIRSVVVPACEKAKPTGPAQTILQASAGSTTAYASSC